MHLDSASQIESRIKADVQREAPDSNPYLKVHWLRSLISGIALRIADFYLDLKRTEHRLMPDTADEVTAPRWGSIFVGPQNPATAAEGLAVATGVAGGVIPIGAVVSAGGESYNVTTGGIIAAQTLSVVSITRVGNIATVTTVSDHNLSSFVPVTISGASESEYNVVAAAITVTGSDTFSYSVTGSPATPAAGVITLTFTAATVSVEAVNFGSDTNQSADTALTLQSPVVDVNDELHVTFGALDGGADVESIADYKTRYLDKIRNPVAHFSASAITAKAKEIDGVTRVFVQSAGTSIGTVDVASITRVGNIATVVTAVPHGFEDGQITTVTGADQADYNVVDRRMIVENDNTFHYVVFNSPATPATGTIKASTVIPFGQVVTYFMRDNDLSSIPSATEVQAVKDNIDLITPANTYAGDNIVKAPVALPVDYTFVALSPNTPSMRDAIIANLQQLHDEFTSVGVDLTQDSYRAAINNTVDPETGNRVESFILSTPVGDIAVGVGQIATKGVVTLP